MLSLPPLIGPVRDVSHSCSASFDAVAFAFKLGVHLDKHLLRVKISLLDYCFICGPAERNHWFGMEVFAHAWEVESDLGPNFR